MVVDEQNGLKYLTVSFIVFKKVRQLKKGKKKNCGNLILANYWHKESLESSMSYKTKGCDKNI